MLKNGGISNGGSEKVRVLFEEDLRVLLDNFMSVIEQCRLESLRSLDYICRPPELRPALSRNSSAHRWP